MLKIIICEDSQDLDHQLDKLEKKLYNTTNLDIFDTNNKNHYELIDEEIGNIFANRYSKDVVISKIFSKSKKDGVLKSVEKFINEKCFNIENKIHISELEKFLNILWNKWKRSVVVFKNYHITKKYDTDWKILKTLKELLKLPNFDIYILETKSSIKLVEKELNKLI